MWKERSLISVLSGKIRGEELQCVDANHKAWEQYLLVSKARLISVASGVAVPLLLLMSFSRVFSRTIFSA